MKGLPLTYNSDMQEDKEPLFDTRRHAGGGPPRRCRPMLRTLTFRVERMREAAGAHYSTATDLADYLVRKGLPFREAHEVGGRAVRHGIANEQRARRAVARGAAGLLAPHRARRARGAHRRGLARRPRGDGRHRAGGGGAGGRRGPAPRGARTPRAVTGPRDAGPHARARAARASSPPSAAARRGRRWRPELRLPAAPADLSANRRRLAASS